MAGVQLLAGLFLLSAVGSAPPPAPAAPASTQAWLVVTRQDDISEAERAYSTIRSTQYAVAGRTSGKPDLSFLVPRISMDGGSGRYAGQWTFFATEGETRPRSAWKLMPPASAPYRVRATLYCRPEDCAALSDQLSRTPSPAVYGDEALAAEWHKIVLTESCDPGPPVQITRPRYPVEELRRGIEGKVGVRVLYNPCGDVRDVWIIATSGNRNLDRATMKEALRWRIAPDKPGIGGQMQTEVSFSL